MLCVICISRGGSASVSFSEVEERAVDLRNVSTVPSQSEPTCDVRPNIIGEPGTRNDGYHSGAFVDGSSSGRAYFIEGNAIDLVSFDASFSSSIFGASVTVQPLAMRSLACIKF